MNKYFILNKKPNKYQAKTLRDVCRFLDSLESNLEVGECKAKITGSGEIHLQIFLIDGKGIKCYREFFIGRSGGIFTRNGFTTRYKTLDEIFN